MMKATTFLAIAACIVGGQYSLAVFARSLGEPWTAVGLILQALRSPALYASAVCYVTGIGLYLMLLRRSGLAETNVPIIVLIIAINLVVSHLAGEHLSAGQWAGAALAAIGLLVMHTL